MLADILHMPHCRLHWLHLLRLDPLPEHVDIHLPRSGLLTICLALLSNADGPVHTASFGCNYITAYMPGAADPTYAFQHELPLALAVF